jgi:peptidyl-prolyl cis-trans isomerase A (cyclophilin A)
MNALRITLIAAVLLACATGCKPKPPATQPAASRPAAPRVELAIGRGGEDWGTIVLELDPEGTPITTKNFLRYVEEGYYDGTIFHRIIADMMIHGGGYTALGVEKPGRHEPILNEALTGRSNKTGAVAMARTEDPNSATSQFFINVVDNRGRLDPGGGETGYAVFGKVISGMDVVERIRQVEVKLNPLDGRKSLPLDPPVLRQARVLK